VIDVAENAKLQTLLQIVKDALQSSHASHSLWTEEENKAIVVMDEYDATVDVPALSVTRRKWHLI
jgi:hypothetical protein